MPKRKRRRDTSYWVCCDCLECMVDIGRPFAYLSYGFMTEEKAWEDLKRYKQDHPSAFVAREVTEAIDPLPQRNPKRKAS